MYSTCPIHCQYSGEFRHVLDFVSWMFSFSARIHKESIINLIICVNPRPVSVHMCTQQTPIRFQAKPHVPSTCKFAMLVKTCRMYRSYLHSSNIKALGPTVGHTVNQISPLAVATLPWQKNCHLGLLGACCLNTPRRIPSLRVANCCRISSTRKSSQSILSLPMSVGRFLFPSIAPT